MTPMKKFAFWLQGLALSIALLCIATESHSAEHQHQKPMTGQLGSSAAFDRDGALWLVGKETSGLEEFLVLRKSLNQGKDWSELARLAGDKVVASGDERPRIAFGPAGEVYVTYSRPLAKPYTSEVRFIRSDDGGRHFSEPLTVHQDRQVITHGFAAMVVDAEGAIYVSWIDKRDLQAARDRGAAYSGAAQYYAVSQDGGKSFAGDYKIADNTCECCRSAVALDQQGRPALMWRHVFAPNVRDHAIVALSRDGKLAPPTRASFDNWAIDACPHQGPSMAFGQDGRRHQTWFTGDGLFYAGQRADGTLDTPMRLGGEQSSHADVAVSGNQVEIVWKEFDGATTSIAGLRSTDGGATWQPRVWASTFGASDQPRLASDRGRIYLIWRTALENVVTIALPAPARPSVAAFGADGMQRIAASHAGKPYVVLVWSLDCVYCHASIKNLAASGMGVVTVAVESAGDGAAREAIVDATSALGANAERWAFGDLPAEQLRFRIDPKWRGELPRSYWFDAAGHQVAVHSGLIKPEMIAQYR